MSEPPLAQTTNCTRPTTLEEENDKKVTLAIPSMIYISVLMIVGIVGNFLVCYVYGCRLKTGAINTFIISLAAFDLLNCCIGMPTEIVDDRYPLMFPSVIACKMLRFTSFYTTASSCLTLTAIAIDRHRRICRPLRKQTNVRQVRIIVIILAISAAIVVCPIVELAGFDRHAQSLPSLNSSNCAIGDTYKNTNYPLFFFLSLSGFFLLSLIIMAVCYVLVWLRLRRHFSVAASSVSTGTQVNSHSSDFRKFSSQKSRKTTKIMFLVTMLYIVSFIPCMIIQIFRSVTGYSEEGLLEMFFNIGLRSSFLGNSLNPFIYGYLNDKFREELKIVCRRFFKCDKADVWRKPPACS